MQNVKVFFSILIIFYCVPSLILLNKYVCNAYAFWTVLSYRASKLGNTQSLQRFRRVATKLKQAIGLIGDGGRAGMRQHWFPDNNWKYLNPTQTKLWDIVTYQVIETAIDFGGISQARSCRQSKKLLPALNFAIFFLDKIHPGEA